MRRSENRIHYMESIDGFHAGRNPGPRNPPPSETVPCDPPRK